MAGLLDGFFGPDGRDARQRMAIGLMGLTHNPNTALMQMWGGEIADRQQKREDADKTNRTLDWMRAQAAQYPKLAPLVGAMETGGIDTGAAVNAAFQIIQEANKPAPDQREYLREVGGDLVYVNPDLTTRTVYDAPAGGDSAKDQSIRRIQGAYGVDYQTAVGIVDGVVQVSRDPLTQEVIITNLATREVFKPQAPQAAAPVPAATTPPSVSQPDLSFGSQYPAGPNAFGMEGFAKNVLNTATDVLPMVGTAFPDEMQTRDDFNVLREQIVNDVAAAYERQPPAWLLENIQALAPTPGSVFEGPDAAASKLKSLGRAFQQEVDAVNQQLSMQISPTQRQTLESRLVGLQTALSRVTTALGAIQPSANGPKKTSSGITFEIVE